MNKFTATSGQTDSDRELLRDFLAVNGFLTVADVGDHIEVKASRLSPLYLSVKALWKRPDLMAAIDEQLLAANSGRRWDVVVGVAFGGIPHATALARRLGSPLTLWDGNRPGGGRFVGEVPHGAESALVIEDVLATGSSAAPSLAELQGRVSFIRLAAVFTYGLDGIIAKARSVDVVTLFPVTCLLDLLDAKMREALGNRYAEFQNRLSAEIAGTGGR